MDAVSEIKARLDLVEYIGRHTRLQKAGRNFRGLCPFHTEKTPSFYVFPDRGTWRCFGSCGDGGDLFSFAQKRENLDFRGALQQLANEAGVQLTAESAQKRGRAEKLMALMSAAVEFYQRCFREEGGAAARIYVYDRRGLKEETVQAFRIGWAPDEWRILRDYLGGRGYDERDMLAAGLLVEPESGGQPYDRFRGRIIIPIADERGQYVAMGGRGLHGEEPKYLNSPQTEIFDKGRTLFGLNVSSEAIRTEGVAVVVEGYMDVMGPWQAGFKNVVATMGTSLTEHHAGLLKRYAKRIVLAMDPDAAGLAAAERAGALFMSLESPEAMARSARSADELQGKTELELRVAPLPAGKDPDEIARDDPAAWASAISGARPYAEFLLTRLMGPTAPDSPVEARRIVDRLRPVLLAVKDPVERAMYVQRIARHLGVTEQSIMERIRPASTRRFVAPEPERRGEEGLAEQTLLAILVLHPALRSEFRIVPAALFTQGADREIFKRWIADDLPVGEDDSLLVRTNEIRATRLPPMTESEAATWAWKYRDAIARERQLEHHVAVSEVLSEAEHELGPKVVDEIASTAWLGGEPPEEHREVAETAIEVLQLGSSIHRRDEPGVAS
ncbi:MAG: DNA primase [Dehalococcoidia bacterium]|nr:DNA primase [Dehalococcoidia bacterium]